ncbi:predicted Zn-dependent peptidases [Zymobacter palmae]|uniref:Predicted Zn-dependent peptidases n=1 Tax=Zymobacter palmae TaxID=33074 RepID=A0A348HGC2_9GAMM|nr:predicted Zn-dependent peptidases [Zymobacter palmae]
MHGHRLFFVLLTQRIVTVPQHRTRDSVVDHFPCDIEAASLQQLQRLLGKSNANQRSFIIAIGRTKHDLTVWKLYDLENRIVDHESPLMVKKRP